MTQRERHTPAAGPACVWEELFQSAAPGRQRQLIALAGTEGVLYTHQLPPTANGAVNRPLLPALLNGQTHDLFPLRPTAVDCVDAALDCVQRDAVARALQTPDLCLIQGLSGSGKSRTAAEVAALAAAGGERVLLLAPTAAAVDCVLERLEGREGVCAVRCPAPGESADALPSGLRRLAFEERLRTFREQTLPSAKQASEEAERRLAVRRGDEAVWVELEDLARRLESLAEEKRGLTEEQADLEREVEAEASAADGASAFHQEMAVGRSRRDAELAGIEARLAELRAEIEKVRGEQKADDDALSQIRPLAEALRDGRWWTGAWWRARGEGDIAQRLDDLEKRRQELAAANERLTREIEERTAERDRTKAHYREVVDLACRQEVERRRAAADLRLAALTCDEETLREKGRTAGLRLGEGVEAPAELSAAAVEAAHAAWRGLRERDEREAARAAQWAEAAEEALVNLPERLAQCANVVGAATSGLAADPRFGDQASPRVTFDLLILEEAHLVTESEFLSAARRARRWVLVGEPTDEAPPSRRTTRPSTLRPGFFQRLWRLLHGDPRCLPYAWFRRGGRLACRLRCASPDEERWARSESLADRPDIELRIAAPPRAAPRLLEVVFPAGIAIQEAKTLLFRELGELTVQARGGGFQWRDDADRVVLDLSDGAAPEAGAVDLDEGVRERLAVTPADNGGACWQTCALEFDRAAGWTRGRAEEWLEDHLQVRDLGRTARLHKPHRCRPALALFLTSVLFNDAHAANGNDDAPAVEFVPVPALGDEARSRPDAEGRARRGGTATAAPRLRSTRGGAGLEIDLADPRRLDPLSAELRAALPGRGLVNLFEARAVVRKLETLAADRAFRAEAAEWVGATRRPALAVLALYPSQAELIRLLMAQSPALVALPAAVEVATPDAFRHRECFAALVSLTRSHSHRAVPFGDDSTQLPTALTRAASRLVLFGDPGTLMRRCQWNGPLDHLDETAGERERGLIARIAAYLHGRGPHPSTFRLDESGGV